MTKEQEQKKKRKGGLVLGIAIVVIIALAGVVIYLLQSRDTEPENERRNVVITPENVESVLKELGDVKETGYYTVTMNPTWHFKTGKEASYDAIVENVVKNSNDIYFDIVLEDDEEKVLYQSPVIPRGGRLEEITFDDALDAGTYNCVAIYHLIDENQKTLSTLRVALDIVVEG